MPRMVRMVAAVGAALALIVAFTACEDDETAADLSSEEDASSADDGEEPTDEEVAAALAESADVFTVSCVGLHEAWIGGSQEAALAFASTGVVAELFAIEVKPPAGTGIAAAEPDCIFDNTDEYVDVVFEGESDGDVTAIAAVAIEVTPVGEASPELTKRFQDAQSAEG